MLKRKKGREASTKPTSDLLFFYGKSGKMLATWQSTARGRNERQSPSVMSKVFSLRSRIAALFSASWFWTTMQSLLCSTSASFSPPMPITSSSDTETSASFVQTSCDCSLLCSISLLRSMSTSAFWLKSSLRKLWLVQLLHLLRQMRPLKPPILVKSC